MKAIQFCAILFISLSAFSQRDSTNIPIAWVKTAAFSNVITYDGSIANIGVEFSLSNQFALNSEIGVYYSMPFKTVHLTNHRGILVREEVKKYSNISASNWKNYFSVELSYADQSFDAIDTIELEMSTPQRFAKSYHSTRQFYGCVLQQGAVRRYPSGFVLEIFAGIGVRYNRVDCTLTDEEASHRDLGDWTVPTNNTLRKGDHLIPRFNFGIKIGYSLL